VKSYAWFGHSQTSFVVDKAAVSVREGFAREINTRAAKEAAAVNNNRRF